MLFQEAREAGIRIESRSVSAKAISDFILSGKYVAIVLVDQYKLSHSQLEDVCISDFYRDSTGYTGHYIVICGYDALTDEFEIRDPASTSENERITSMRLEHARKSFGTDEDLLLVISALSAAHCCPNSYTDSDSPQSWNSTSHHSICKFHDCTGSLICMKHRYPRFHKPTTGLSAFMVSLFCRYLSTREAMKRMILSDYFCCDRVLRNGTVDFMLLTRARRRQLACTELHRTIYFCMPWFSATFPCCLFPLTVKYGICA